MTAQHTIAPRLLVSRSEAAELYGVSVSTYQKLERDGIAPGPVIKKPRLVRYSVDELRAAIARKEGRKNNTKTTRLEDALDAF